MVELNGYKIDNSFIKNLNKVYDLIEYDGPILSHFIDNKKRNYFYLWVDRNNFFNRWLIWKVDDLELHKYLTGKTSLKDLLLAPTKDFIYVADIDSKLNYLNLIASDVTDIPAEYLPENESFFDLEFDYENPYQKFIDQKNREYYTEFLKENSVYLKIENQSTKQGRFISLSEITVFVNSVSSSYGGYVAVDFHKNFDNYFSDSKRLNSILKSVQEVLDPKGVEYVENSFEIGLAIDKSMIRSKIQDQNLRNWAISVLEKYKKDVIELDYNKDEEIERIIMNYSADERALIYDPLIRLSKNKKIKFLYRDKGQDKKYKIIKIKTEKALKLSPKPEKIPDEKEYELINALVWARKSNKIILTEENTLFAIRENEHPIYLKTEDFKKEGYDVDITESFKVEVSSNGNQIKMTAYINDKELNSSSEDSKIAKTKLIEKIYFELKETNVKKW